ncbi:HAD hydrolase-like protein [Streptococcus didelphis]|uniref:HAD hydrolase-like protein n=1 Tax=Streptococcus didelphis TaxID=102886 RepID=A0ABY9LFD8_9STRE|nr:HAD hydrolase-like protein [Streptococcus didelphis]WMB27640.1 HAD hydrolase-like protein [Streptococcus didelphis]WMB29896.1 HAD hydrolase-like protein [Streptococcus didelphis]
MNSILFDLDGTLVDSSLGIINAFQETFDKLQLLTPDVKVLSSYIGPPLETTFANYFDNQNDIQEAIGHFRNYYKAYGVYQVKLYEDIKKLLDKLTEANKDLYITTSKHEPMAYLMLKELGIHHYFKAIYGATEQRFVKVDLINACLKDFQIKPSDAVIIGDTLFDMIGGKRAHISCLGVTWGFGSEEELLKNGANIIAHTPLEIQDLI